MREEETFGKVLSSTCRLQLSRVFTAFTSDSDLSHICCANNETFVNTFALFIDLIEADAPST